MKINKKLILVCSLTCIFSVFTSIGIIKHFNNKPNNNVVVEKEPFEIKESTTAQDEIFSNGEKSPVAGEVEYKQTSLNKVNNKEDLSLTKPKIGYQMAISADGKSVSVRFTAAVNSLNVTANWTRAMYDSDGLVYEPLMEEEKPVTEAYTGLTNGGKISYAIDEVDIFGNKPYNYYVVYTLLDIPLAGYGTYYLDASLTLANGNGSVTSVVGAIEINNTNHFSYEKGTIEDLTFTKDDDNKSYKVKGNNKDSKEVVVPGYYSDKNGRYKVDEIEENAFSNFEGLEYVDIPETVDVIGANAFTGSKNAKLFIRGHEQKGENWDEQWNSDNNPTAFEYIGHYSEKDGVVYAVSRNSDNKKLYSMVVGYSEDVDSSISLRDKYNGVEVTKIVDYAFSGCDWLEHITLPDSLVSIGVAAFLDCEILNTISTPDTLEKIGDYAFYNCNNIREIIIPKGVTTIGKQAFYSSMYHSIIYCEADSRPNGWASNWNSSFPVYWGTDNKYLEIDGIQYIIENGKATISNYVGNDIILSIPSFVKVGEEEYEVTKIGSFAFRYSNTLREVNIPNSIVEIQSSAFRWCDSIENIYFANDTKLKTLGDTAFWANQKLQFSIFDKAKYLGSRENPYLILIDAKYHETCQIHSQTKIIGSHAFQSSQESNLKSITIPQGIEVICDNAFYWCKNLTEVIYEENSNLKIIGDSAFFNCCTMLTNQIPQNVEYIGEKAFASCSDLKYLHIPQSVTTIGSDAFDSCLSISLYCESVSKPIGWANSWNDSAWNKCVLWGINESNFVENNGVQYVVLDGKAKVINYVGNSSVIDILSTINIDSAIYNVTSIGKKAFYHYSSNGNITKVNLPNGIEIIETYAFESCENLRQINIPESIKTIETRAFSYCSSLVMVVLSENITKVGDYIFDGCNSLTVFCEVTSRPNGWSYFWDRNTTNTVIWGVGVDKVLLQDDIQYLVENGNASVVKYFGSSEKVTIPSTIEISNITYEVSKIYSSAFANCELINEVEISNGVKTIEDNAFYSCDSLIKVTIPNTVLNIGKNVFKECVSLEMVEFEENSKITTIGSYVFDGCLSLASISIPKTLTIIEEYAFNNCSNLKTVEFEENSNLSTIKVSAFKNCSSLENIIIPQDVTEIYNGAFMYCSNLKIVEFEENSKLTKIYQSAFDSCIALENIIIPNSVETIGGSVFYNCSNLKTVEFEENSKITSINYSVFYNCIALENIIIPKSVKTIENYAFRNCSSLTSVFFEEGSTFTSVGYFSFYDCKNLKEIYFPNTLENIGEAAFSNCKSLERVEISDSVTSIGNGAFSGCSALKSITIPNSVTNIGMEAFRNCTSLVIYCEVAEKPSTWDALWNYSENPVYWNISQKLIEINGVQYIIENSEAIMINYIGQGSEVNVLPEITFNGKKYPVTQIGARSFLNGQNLISITIPNTISSLEANIFSNCTSLEKLSVPFIGQNLDGSGETYIGYWFGAQKYSENDKYVPKSLSEVIVSDESIIGNYAFAYCGTLTNIEVQGDVTNIGNGAFYNCLVLEKITLPDTITSIGDSAFSGCSSLTSIVIPEGVTSIGGSTFSNCSSLTSIIIPNSVTSIGYNAFSNCGSLTSIIIPNSVTNIETSALYNCKNLEKITMPLANVSYLGQLFGASTYQNQANYVPTTLKEIVITSGTKIENYAFSNCDYIETVTIPNSVKTIGTNAFSCKSLIDVYYNGIIEEWVEISFSTSYSNPMCNANNIYMLDENGNVEHNSLKYSLLTELVIPDSVTSIGSYALRGCNSLTSIVIPNSVTSIGSYAFAGCSNLISVTFEEGSQLTNIGNGAFESCSSLERIKIPNSVTSIGGATFANCKTLENIIMPMANVEFIAQLFGTYTSSQYNSFLPSSLKEITILSGEIKTYAFAYCGSLTTIIIKENVTYIGDYAFNKCGSLTIYCEMNSQPTNWSSIWNISNCPVIWGAYNKVTFINYDGTILYETNVLNNHSAEYAGVIPTRLGDERVETYTFAGWDVSFDNVTTDLVVTAMYDEILKEYTVTFVDYNGTVLYEDKLHYQETAEYVGETPVRESNAQYDYTFKGWDKTFDNITSDLVVTAMYDETLKEYTVTFVNYDGTVLYEDKVNYQEVAEYVGETPVRESNAQYDYTFKGWDKTFDNITSDLVVTAMYDEILKEYTVTFVDYDGTVLYEDKVYYQETAEYVGDIPTRYADEFAKSYNFSGWDRILDNVTSDLVITAQYEIAENWEYTFTVNHSDNTFTITGYKGTDAVLFLPSTVFVYGKNYNIICVESAAFKNCEFIKKVNIPSTVENIGKGAFVGCNSLESITMPIANVEYIGHLFGAYSYEYNKYIPSSLKTIGISKGTHIPSNAFYGCLTIENIIFIDSGVTFIGDSAFEECISLKQTVIPYTVKNVGNYAYKGCTQLSSIAVNSGVQTIGDYAFANCPVSEIKIPSSVTRIGEGAFSGCNSLRTMDIPFAGHSTENAISNFGYMFGTASVSEQNDYIPTSLKNVYIIGSTNIGSYAFYGCENIEYIFIGKQITSIGSNAFAACTSLELINFEEKSKLNSIGDSAFEGCSSLYSITISKQVTYVGAKAFRNCNSLTIYCKADTQPSEWNANWNYSNCKVEWGYVED